MPYKKQWEDRRWHKLVMRERRLQLKLDGKVVTPDVTPNGDDLRFPNSDPIIDADGNPVYEG